MPVMVGLTVILMGAHILEELIFELGMNRVEISGRAWQVEGTEPEAQAQRTAGIQKG